MGDNITLPVVAGLALGIGFVIILALVLASFTESRNVVFAMEGHNRFRPDRYEYVNIFINDLNEAYRAGQPIIFSAFFRGYAPMCDTAPTLKIIQSDTDKVVYDYDPLVLAMCGPDDFIDKNWTFGEGNDIVFYETGKYKLIVEQYEQTVEKEFDVISSNSVISVNAEQVSGGRVIEVNIEDSDNILSDYSQVPPKMSMIVYPPANQSGLTFYWKGETGSYCWGRICADTVFIVPEFGIELLKGSTVEFQVANNEQPDELGVLVYRDADRLADHQITDLPNDEYLVNLPHGEYILFVGATWKDGEFSAGSAVYYYKITVV